jgi:hypothetical protein
MMKPQRLGGILLWVMVTGTVLVCLAILVASRITTVVIESAAAENRHAEFLLVADSVSRLVGASDGVHNLSALQAAFQNILDLRPGMKTGGCWEYMPSALVQRS